MTDFDLTFDRPFLYLIRDRATNTIVFMGRMTDPSSD
jgi:serine protease inhibitor